MIKLFGIDELLILILAIFLIFRGLQLIKKFIKKKKISIIFSKALVTVELFVWISLFLKAANHFQLVNPMVAFLILVLITLWLIFTFWFVLIDFISGLYVRINGTIKLNTQIKVDKFSGTIIYMGNTAFHLKLNNQQTVLIPYSKVLKKEFIYIYDNAPFIELNEDIYVDSIKALQKKESLQQQLKLLPWINNQLPVIVKILPFDEKQSILSVSLALKDVAFKELFLKTLRAFQDK